MNRSRCQRRAFTLIEVALVVLLFGTLAGVAAMSFARPLRAARVREAVAEIAAFDAAARQLARRTGRAVEFEIDTYEQRLARAGAELHLPRGVRIEQARQASDAPGGSPLTIRVAPHGWSRSYALRVVGPDYDRWLLVSGMSGQVSVVQDESNVEDILARATRRDAD